MKVVASWLKDFIKLPDSVSSSDLGARLTESVVEVESIVDQRAQFEHIFAARIIKLEKHPNADRLTIAHVDAGKKGTYLIVCGGNNLYEGQSIILALPGSRVRWHGEGDLITLEPAKVRGVESQGMICSVKEIGLDALIAEPEGGIADLKEYTFVPGTPLADVLGMNDAVIDIDNKSMNHRPDLWCHYGIAREVAGLYNTSLAPLEKYITLTSKSIARINNKKSTLNITINDDRCVRYIGVVISGVAPVSSPDWIADRLRKVGIRPKNILIDVTNYVMLELGNPLHAFDYDRLDDHSIVVRRAHDSEKIIGLDDREYTLNSDIMVIADQSKPIAIAGVIGGKNDSIQDSTTKIVLEGAAFDAVAVRRASMALGIRTDASARFEKSLDPLGSSHAILRAVEILQGIFPEMQIEAYEDHNNFKYTPKIITISEEYIQARIGDIRITKKIATDILTRLGFEVSSSKNTLTVIVPSWRATKDISIKDDLIEEIARIYGYSTITPQLPMIQIEKPKVNSFQKRIREIKNILALRFNCTEHSLYPFVSDAMMSTFQLDSKKHIHITNSLNSEASHLRSSLLPNLIEKVAENIHRSNQLRFFEIGRVFFTHPGNFDQFPKSTHQLPDQPYYLNVTLSNTDNSLQDMVNIINELSILCGVDLTIRQLSNTDHHMHPGSSAEVLCNGKKIGFVFRVNPIVLNTLSIDKTVYTLEINLDMLSTYTHQNKIFKPLPTYPIVERDLSPLVSIDTTFGTIASSIQEINKAIVKVDLIDTFKKGDKISMTVRLYLRRDDRTWETKEIDTIIEQVINQLETKIKAEIPR